MKEYQVTQQMLKNIVVVKKDDMMIGKKKPSIMKVDIFDRHEDQFSQKKLKRRTRINESIRII